MNKHTHNAPTINFQSSLRTDTKPHVFGIKTEAHKMFTSYSKSKDTSDTITFKNVAVIGLGYVGLPLALLADKKGHKVYGVDTNVRLIQKIQKHNTPDFLHEESEQKVFAEHAIDARVDVQRVRDADVIIICVPTPVSIDHKPNLQLLISATISIAPKVRPGTLVIVESTVSPGVSEEVVLPILEQNKKLVREKTLFFAHCPERINPGDKVWKLNTIPRVVGAIGPQSLKKAVSFYSKLLDTQVQPMKSLQEAEAVKMVENSFRDINIAFVNELAMSFQKLGIDIVDVIEGASTKPFSFMAHFPGIGVGGHCIPVDPYYLIEEAKKNGFNHKFLKVARIVNNSMPKFAVTLLRQALAKKHIRIRGARIALLGLAYKRDISDTRESPALQVRDELEKIGIKVNTFDPYVPTLSTAKTLKEALQNTQAVVIATDHQLFRSLSPELLVKQNINIVLDGRNCLRKEKFVKAGVTYIGIGR